MILLLLLQLATWEPPPHAPGVLHQGTWESCVVTEDGLYAERILEHRQNGALEWELHLGPGSEFALFDHMVNLEGHPHDVDNLLNPYIITWTAQEWNVEHLALTIVVLRNAEQHENCDAFFITIRTTKVNHG